MAQYIRRRSSDGDIVAFFRDTSQVGSISVTTSATAYNVSSDIRLKTNIRDFDSSGAVIDELKPRVFDWKSGEKDTYGFVAQEVNEVYPQAVTPGDDGAYIKEIWSIDMSKLMPVVIAELKALRRRVAELERRG